MQSTSMFLFAQTQLVFMTLNIVNGYIITPSSSSITRTSSTTTTTTKQSWNCNSIFQNSIYNKNPSYSTRTSSRTQFIQKALNNNNNNENDDSVVDTNESILSKKLDNTVQGQSNRRQAIQDGITLASILVGTSTIISNSQSSFAASTVDDMSSSSLSSTSTSTSSPVVEVPSNNEKRTIVLTGGNSGIGYEASKRLATIEGTTLVLACRSIEKAKDAIERIKTSIEESSSESSANNKIRATLIPAECDLGNLQSIDNFVSNISTILPSSTIDVLALNAGISRNVDSKECTRTVDGFEETIGINHFGHFYLCNKLLSKVTNKIIVTASSVHDPNSPGGAQGMTASLGTMDGLETVGKQCEMINGQSFNADKAYKDSKLCNVLFTRELQKRINNSKSLNVNNQICVNCFTPGLIVETGLFRNQNPFFTKAFNIVATYILKVGETPTYGGLALLYMINTIDTKGYYYFSPPGSYAKYGESVFTSPNKNVFIPTEVSIEAQDNDKAKRLWELSEKVLNIKSVI